MNNTTQIHEAVRLLGLYTGRSFEICRLVGPAKSTGRQQIMTAMTGSPELMRKSKCGIAVIESAFREQFKPIGNCESAIRNSLADACRELLAAE